jgi:serine protease Do
MGIKEKGGVLITEVLPASFAEDIGLAQKMVLLSINRQPVNSVEDVRRIQATLKPGDAVAFRVLAQGRTGEWTPAFVAGTLPSSNQ